MIVRVIMAISIVLGSYFLPGITASDYTNLSVLRENSCFHAAVIALMIIFVRGWVGIAICCIELFLIAANFHVAFNWGIRDQIWISSNYSIIQDSAFYLELAIIAVKIITGLREIGTDINRYRDSRSSCSGPLVDHERNQ